jgi:hypothetical protein
LENKIDKKNDRADPSKKDKNKNRDKIDNVKIDVLMIIVPANNPKIKGIKLKKE